MINIWTHSGRTCSKDWSYTRVIQYEFVGAANEEVRDVQSRFKHRLSFFKQISMSLNDKKLCFFMLKFCFRSACRELCLGATTYLCRWLFRTIFHLGGNSTVPLYHCTTVPLYHCTTVPLYHVPVTSFVISSASHVTLCSCCHFSNPHDSWPRVTFSNPSKPSQWLSSFRAMKANYNVSKF